MAGICERLLNPENGRKFFESGIDMVGNLTKLLPTGAGNLTKLLPTGTVFLFQFLNPLLTNNGQCDTIHKYLSGFLIAFCGFFCFFSSFTDSYTGADRLTHYGFVTINGIWPVTNPGPSFVLLSYKLKPLDFVHAFLSLFVFAALALLDSNTVECFLPSFESSHKNLIWVVSLVVGAVSSVVFMCVPNIRHGFGYPSSRSESSQESSS